MTPYEAERLRELEAEFNADAKKWLEKGSGMTREQETGASMVWCWLSERIRKQHQVSRE